MKIAVIGATGFVGSSIVRELVYRNHQVLGISRKADLAGTERLQYLAVDIFNQEVLAEALKGYDVVVNAFFSGFQVPEVYNTFLSGLVSIQNAVKLAGVSRLVVIGEASSLYVSEGVQLFDTPDFPQEYALGSAAAKHYLEIIKKETELDWTYFCPAPEMHAGITTGRTGKYRLGLENPVYDDHNRSQLSVEDVGVVIADEIEQPRHRHTRFTAAY